MYNFKGISSSAINLLSENRFNNSKDFYELHKEEIKQGAVVPMRQIMLDLSETLCDLDDKIYTHPIYTVSRVRRDTRHTKSKLLYRENLWVMFRRNKFEYPNAPCMWFEFTPFCYSYGIGMWCQKPVQMDELRKLIINHPKKFKQAADKLTDNGFTFNSEMYKKDRDATVPLYVKDYFNSKYIQFIHSDSNLTKINTPDLIDELKEFIKTAEPMYKIMIQAYENIISEGLI